MPLKNNKTSYQRLQEDLDYRLDQINKAQQAAFDAVNRPATQSKPSGYNSAVRRQNQLRSLGFYKGAIDGKWGKGSNAAHRAAVNAGYILNSQGIYVRKPQAQKALHQKALTENQRRQSQLKQLGFYKGSIDDKFGPQSRAAHQAAIDAGYVYSNGEYHPTIKPEPIRTQASIFSSSDNSEPQQTTRKPSSIRVDFPNHGIDVQNDTGHPWLEKAARFLGIKRVPLGHSGVIFVDENGKTKYYDYGRYSNDPNIIGQHADGNYRRISVPDMLPGESIDDYTVRLAKAFPDEGTIRTRMYEGADIKAAEQKILADAANKDRDSYNLFLKNCKAIAKDAAEAGLLMPIGEGSFYVNNNRQ